MKFGVREICDVVLKAKAKQKIGNKTFLKDEPVIYFDTAKTSSLEGAATTVYAQGGRGNSRLIAWEGERTLTFTLEDALLSPKGFSILSGAGLIDATATEPIFVHQTTQLAVSKDEYEGTGSEGHTKTAKTFQLIDEESGEPIAIASTTDNPSAATYILIIDDDSEFVYEPCVPSSTGTNLATGTISCHALDEYFKNYDNAIVIVDYYVKKAAGTTQIEITPDKFGGYFYLEASTLFRKESTGVDMAAEIIIPKVKIQSNFTFSMAATGDPSTFTFTMDAFPDYVKFDKSHKVLAAIQIVDETATSEDLVRICGTSGPEISEGADGQKGSL